MPPTRFPSPCELVLRENDEGDGSEYRRYVQEWMRKGISNKKDELYGFNSILGSKEFLENVFQKLKEKIHQKDTREIPDPHYDLKCCFSHCL